MDYTFLLSIIPACSALICFGLAGLLLSARHHAVERRWMIILMLVTGLWALGITFFLLARDRPIAAQWAHFYYLMAAAIPYSLIMVAMNFPRRYFDMHVTRIALFIGFLAAAYLAVDPTRVVQDVVMKPGGVHEVALGSFSYPVYCVYFIVYTAIAAFFLLRSIAWLRYKPDERRRLITVFAGMKIALAFGAFFNLILPLFGTYSLVWVGPPCAIIFVAAMFYAIIHQGLFDMRATLARSVSYSLLVVSLVVLYGSLVVIVTSFMTGYRISTGVALLYVVLALAITVTHTPLKRFIDRTTHRLFYRNDYDLREMSRQVNQITAHEVAFRPLIKKTLTVLDQALAPEYIVAYATDEEGTLRRFREGSVVPHKYQSMQQDIVTTLLDRLPQVIERTELALDGDELLRQVMHTSGSAVIIQLIVQHERIGALFVGEKRGGGHYDEKDMQLLVTSAEELALAIESSLRFEEIQQFNETLKHRVADATQRLRRTNRELQKLDQAKDEFISMASHQLRTPLTSVKGYISMVMDGDVGKVTDQQKHLLAEAFTSSERMVHLIADLLSVSRLQTGKFIIDVAPANIDEIISDELATLQSIAAAHGQKLSYVRPVSTREVMIDEAKIRQVIMNFIDNAIYYSRLDSEIVVELGYGKKDLTLTVTDHGIGVPTDEQSKLFTKFFRASNGRKQRPDGTGIGLFLAKKVVTAHGGHIIFRSKEGEGSTFGFRLPIVSAPADESTQSQSEPGQARPPRQ